MEYDFDIFYYVNSYKKWWKKIVLMIIVTMVFTKGILFFLPVTYISTVTIIMADTGGGSGAEGALGKLLGLSGLSGESSSVNVIISILQSRRMANDIREKFKLDERRNVRYSIGTHDIYAGIAIDVRGNDPQLTKEIANFTVQNLDKINTELNITPAKPMVKILDSALNGSPVPNKGKRKIILAGLVSFLLMNLYIFFLDYINKIKKH